MFHWPLHALYLVFWVHESTLEEVLEVVRFVRQHQWPTPRVGFMKQATVLPLGRCEAGTGNVSSIRIIAFHSPYTADRGLRWMSKSKSKS